MPTATTQAIQDVMPPVLFQGCWSIGNVLGWALCYMYLVLWQCPLESCRNTILFFCTPQISTKSNALRRQLLHRQLRHWLLEGARSARGCYAVAWHWTNIASWYLPCDCKKVVDLTMTLLTLGLLTGCLLLWNIQAWYVSSYHEKFKCHVWFSGIIGYNMTNC